MTEQRKGKTVSFTSEVKAEGGVKHGRKGKVVTFSAPVVKPFKSIKPIDPVIQSKLDNITENTANMFNQHGEILNQIAFWIAEQDPKVKAAGNVSKWAMQIMKERQELQERKDALKVKQLGDADKKK